MVFPLLHQFDFHNFICYFIKDLISYNGAVIHVGKLMEQIKRTEKNFSDLEKIYNDLRKQNTDLQKEHSKSSSKMKELQSEVKTLNRKLSDTDQGLYAINVCFIIYVFKFYSTFLFTAQVQRSAFDVILYLSQSITIFQ